MRSMKDVEKSDQAVAQSRIGISFQPQNHIKTGGEIALRAES